jgi:hypothetical protein
MLSNIPKILKYFPFMRKKNIAVNKSKKIGPIFLRCVKYCTMLTHLLKVYLSSIYMAKHKLDVMMLRSPSFFYRRKQRAPTSEPLGADASGEDVEADRTQQPEAAGAPASATAGEPVGAPEKDGGGEEGTLLAKNNVSLGQTITNILARLKQTAEKKGEEKRLDETLAEEFERVRLSEEEGEGEEKGQREVKGEKEEGVIKESIRERIRALFNRMKKAEDVEMVEAPTREVEGGEAVEEGEEEKMEELEPEDKEEKTEVRVEAAPRIGSETPV